MTCLEGKLENVLLSTLKVCLSVDGNHNQLITDECSPHQLLQSDYLAPLKI